MHRPPLYTIIIIENRNVLSYDVLYLNIEEDIMVIQQQEEKEDRAVALRRNMWCSGDNNNDNKT
jgi:hypothetical protein